MNRILLLYILCFELSFRTFAADSEYIQKAIVTLS